MKKISAIFLIVCILFSSVPVLAETADEVSVFVDGKKVVGDNMVIEIKGDHYVQLIPVLEAMGAEVRVENRGGEDKDIFFDYAGDEYVCQIKCFSPSTAPEPFWEYETGFYFTRANTLELDRREQWYNLIRLGYRTIKGDYYVKDDITYISCNTWLYLLDALGCGFRFDEENGVIEISLNDKSNEVFTDYTKVEAAKRMTVTVDGEKVAGENMVIENDGEYYVQLLPVLEALAGEARYEERNGDTYIFFDFSGLEYVCQIRYIPIYSYEKGFYFSRSRALELPIYEQWWLALAKLADDSANGEYCIKENITYISCDTWISLLNKLGCGFKLDEENLIIEISSNKDNPGELYINDIKVDLADDFIMVNDSDGYNCRDMFVPLRAILEAMGSTVEWNVENKEIYFDYDNVNYVYTTHNEDTFLVFREEDRGTDNYLRLHPYVPLGYYKIVNDRTYVPELTMKYLLEELGLRCEINAGERWVKIWTK